MDTLKRIYDEVMDQEPPDVPVHPPVDIPEPDRLAKALDTDPETALKVLHLIDGQEDFAQLPPSPLGGEELLPQLGHEGFRETIEQLIEWLKAFFKRIGEWLEDHADQTANALRALKWDAENLRMHARSTPPNVNSRIPIRMDTHVASLSVFYKPPTRIADVINNLRRLEQELAAYYHWVNRTALPMAGQVAGFIRRLDPQRMRETDVNQVVASLRRSAPQNFGGIKLSEVDGAHKFGGPNMLGNRRLVFTLPPLNREDPLQAVNHSSVRLMPSLVTPRPVPDHFEIPRFPLTSSDHLCDQVLSVIKLMETHYDPATVRRRKMALKELHQAIDVFGSATLVIPDGERWRKEQANRLLVTLRTQADWLTNPYRGLSATAVYAMRGALHLGHRNIASSD